MKIEFIQQDNGGYRGAWVRDGKEENLWMCGEGVRSIFGDLKESFTLRVSKNPHKGSRRVQLLSEDYVAVYERGVNGWVNITEEEIDFSIKMFFDAFNRSVLYVSVEQEIKKPDKPERKAKAAPVASVQFFREDTSYDYFDSKDGAFDLCSEGVAIAFQDEFSEDQINEALAIEISLFNEQVPNSIPVTINEDEPENLQIPNRQYPIELSGNIVYYFERSLGLVINDSRTFYLTLEILKDES